MTEETKQHFIDLLSSDDKSFRDIATLQLENNFGGYDEIFENLRDTIHYIESLQDGEKLSIRVFDIEQIFFATGRFPTRNLTGSNFIRYTPKVFNNYGHYPEGQSFQGLLRLTRIQSFDIALGKNSILDDMPKLSFALFKFCYICKDFLFRSKSIASLELEGCILEGENLDSIDMPNLQHLYISKCKIDDFSFIERVPKLKALFLDLNISEDKVDLIKNKYGKKIQIEIK